jgi:hypothetical protein
VETLEIDIINLKLGICLGRVIQNVCLNLDCPSVGKPDSILVVLSFVCLSVGTLIINIVCAQFFLSVFLRVVFGNLERKRLGYSMSVCLSVGTLEIVIGSFKL